MPYKKNPLPSHFNSISVSLLCKVFPISKLSFLSNDVNSGPLNDQDWTRTAANTCSQHCWQQQGCFHSRKYNGPWCF